MAITTAMCTSFKSELLGGTHDLDTDSIKLALIKATPTGTYGAATTNYSDVTGNSDEATGTGYTAGGQVLDNVTISVDGTTAIVDIEMKYLLLLLFRQMVVLFTTQVLQTQQLQ